MEEVSPLAVDAQLRSFRHLLLRVRHIPFSPLLDLAEQQRVQAQFLDHGHLSIDVVEVRGRGYQIEHKAVLLALHDAERLAEAEVAEDVE